MKPEDIGIIMYWSALIATLIALVGLALATLNNQKQSRKENYRVVVVEKCYKCGYTREREYQKEDYVGKITGNCPKCGAPLYIDAIYEVKISKQKQGLLSTPRVTKTI